MARRKIPPIAEQGEIDLIPMMDLSLNLTFFFVVLTTLAKDEITQRITLPIAASSVVTEEVKSPDLLRINVDAEARVLNWGLQLDLKQEAGLKSLDRQMKLEAARQKQRQGPDWRKTGLTTTIILRVDKSVEYTIFRKVIDICRQNGFRKFVLKAQSSV